MMSSIDINCDMGESYGRFVVGNDELIFPYISSCNIACGFHGGDPVTIERTLALATRHNTRVGAHPSYPDLKGFGRRVMYMSDTELRACIRYQVATLSGLCKAHGISLFYVKPHGALYNRMASDVNTATVVYEAIRSIDPKLMVMGLAGSHTSAIADELGLAHISEAFADRRYTADGQLMSRKIPGAVITDPEEAAAQALNIAKNGYVVANDGSKVTLDAQSICIHGDTRTALDIAKAVASLMHTNSIEISSG